MPASGHFELEFRARGSMVVPTLELPDSDRNLYVYLQGPIINSITARTEALRNWKERVVAAVQKRRGEAAWNPESEFAITLVLKFCPQLHGGHQKLDVENFIKPIIDGLAAGLFCEPGTEPSDIKRFDYDDSNFDLLLIQRLPDVREPSEEGVAINVSVRYTEGVV